MSLIVTIFLVIVGILVLLLMIGLFTRRNHYVKREIIINAPTQRVFDFLRLHCKTQMLLKRRLVRICLFYSRAMISW